MFIKYLTAEGQRVKFVLTGEKAIEMVKKESFDIVLLDFKLPGISGLEVLKKIKDVSPEVKVIMMSGIGDKDLEDKFIEKGASGCLWKPFKLVDIEKILK